MPDFIIVGAMKCATSTLHDQLAVQDGIFMSTPKEPNFFSDDGVYKNGIDWYSRLFSDPNAVLNGESSTHYTKFPTYPLTIERMLEHGLQGTKLIYVMRHPIQRLVSHYIHEWSQGIYKVDINDAVNTYSELVNYSRYHYQLGHYLQHFSSNQILPMFYESLISRPEEELLRACEFIGYQGNPKWNYDMDAQNVSSQRIRKFPLYSLLIDSPILAFLRRSLVPQAVRDRVKTSLTMKERPQLSDANNEKLCSIFDEDLASLGALFNMNLSCATFKGEALKQFPSIV